MLDQAAREFRSCCNRWQSSLDNNIRFLYSFVSSAKILATDSTHRGRPFTYNRKRTGSRMEPCRTPLVTGRQCDISLRLRPFVAINVQMYCISISNHDLCYVALCSPTRLSPIAGTREEKHSVSKQSFLVKKET